MSTFSSTIMTFLYELVDFQQIFTLALFAAIYHYWLVPDPVAPTNRVPQHVVVVDHHSASTPCTFDMSESDESSTENNKRRTLLQLFSKQQQSKARRIVMTPLKAMKKSPVAKGCQSLAKGVSDKVKEAQNAQKARALKRMMDYFEENIDTMEEEDGRQATGFVGKMREYNTARKNRAMARDWEYMENNFDTFCD